MFSGFWVKVSRIESLQDEEHTVVRLGSYCSDALHILVVGKARGNMGGAGNKTFYGK